MSWDPFQREVLDALGHALYRVAGDGDPVVAETPAAAQAAEPAQVRAQGGGGGGQDALLAALLRAAGCRPGSPEAAALGGRWDLATLRGAAAKRALWPQLRRLRRPGLPA